MATKLALVELLKDEDLHSIANSKNMLDATIQAAKDELSRREELKTQRR